MTREPTRGGQGEERSHRHGPDRFPRPAFPSDRSLGWLLIPPSTPDAQDSWQTVGPAIGAVAVPLGQPVRLVVDTRAGSDRSPLRQLPPEALQELWLVQTGVSSTQLGHVSHLTGLQVLTLGHTAVRDTALAYLVTLQHLRELHLNGTDITDEGLGMVRRLTRLEVLSLGGTLVTDAGLVHLYGLSALKCLSLDASYTGRDTRVSSEGVAALQRALPNCDVLWCTWAP
jgi:hypothetical protein